MMAQGLNPLVFTVFVCTSIVSTCWDLSLFIICYVGQQWVRCFFSDPICTTPFALHGGLDIKELQAVINFELSRDPEVHIHRIGRTDRAGKKGIAISLFIASEAYRINALEEYLKSPIKIETLRNREIEEGFKLQSLGYLLYRWRTQGEGSSR